MTAYITIGRFKLLSTIPSGFVDEVEAVESGFTLAQLEYFSAWIDTQLAKRYEAPFASPVPYVVEGWLARIVTPRVWTKRGVNATDEQWQDIRKDDLDARAEIAQAANSETGLFDLPLRQNTTISGIAKGYPRVYSEQSPYVWTDIQRARATQEDESGSGSGTP